MTPNDNPSAPLEALLSVDQARKLVGISEAGLYRLIRGGEIPVVKLGSRTLIEPRVIRELIESRRRVAEVIAGRQHSRGSTAQ